MENKIRKLKDKASKFADKGKTKKAIEIYERILTLDPSEVSTMMKVGELLRRIGRINEAVSAFAQAAEYYAKDKMFLRAIAVCKVILELDSLHTATQELLADLYIKKYGGPLHGLDEETDQEESERAVIDTPQKDIQSVRDTMVSGVVEIDLSDLEDLGTEMTESNTSKSGGKTELSLLMPVPGDDLPHIPLFSDLDKESFVSLLKRIPIHNHERGEEIVTEGSLGTSFYVLVSGSVSVFKGDNTPLATLKSGAFFGEMAIVSSRPRQASVVTLEQSEILEVPKVELDILAKKLPSIYDVLMRFTQQRLLGNLMLTSSIFTPFSKKERKKLMRRFRSTSAPDNRAIIEQGQDGKGLYLIVSGCAKVVYKDENDEDHLVTKLSEGDIIGETALLTRSKSKTTARAVGKVHLLRLSKDTFNELIMTHPQILILVSDLVDTRKQGIEDAVKRDLVSEEDGGSALL